MNNLGLSLTGGLDSRILLAAGFDGNTFTWGYNEDNDEITLAKRCSETNLNPWKFIKVTPEEFLDPSGAGDFIREGLDLFVQSHGLICYPEVRDSGVSGLMTGLALDFTMAGSYCPSNAHDMSEQKMYDYAFKKIETFSSEDRSLLFKDKSLIERVKNIESAVKNELSKDFSKGSAVSALQNFFMENRVRRQIFQRQQWQRAYCEDYIPTFDNRLVDYLSRFSLEERSNHKIFQKVLLLLSSNLASIPYQGTNLPASVPVEYWESATQIEAMKEQLYRKIFNETTGMVFVPYNRYYSNFDEWMRTNAEWQNHIADLLLSDKSRILGFLNRNVINTWVNDQISAKIPRYGKIIELMNLEKTLRAFF